MIENQNISQRIEDYLRGNLDQKERAVFEKELESNEVLREEVALEKMILEAVEFQGLTNYSSELNAVFKQEKRKEIIKKGALIGLGLVLVSVGVFSFWKKDNEVEKINTEKLSTLQKSESSNIVAIDSSTNEVKESVEEQTITTVPETNEVIKESISKKINEPSKDEVVIIQNDTLPLDSKKSPTISEEKKEKQVEESSSQVPDPCLTIILVATPQITATCENENKGVVELDNTTGGKAPYSYRLENGNWQKQNSFSQLSKGTYVYEIKDANDCVKKANVVVKEMPCYKPEVGFNPTYETWEYQAYWEGPARIKLYDKSGAIIFETTTEEDFIWDGKNNRGELVPSGLYIYSIEANEMKSGSVSVIY